MKVGTIVMKKSKRDMEVTAGMGRQRVVQYVVERMEGFLLGKITHNQVIDQIGQQFENMDNEGKLEHDFSVELNKYKLGDQFVREAKKLIILNLEAYLEGRNTIEEFAEVLEVVLATQKERTNDDNDFEIDENGDIFEVSEIEKHEENANYRLSRYSRTDSEDVFCHNEIKEKANKRFKSDAQRQACLRSVEGKKNFQYLYTDVDVITRKNFIAPGEYGEASQITKKYLFMIGQSIECEDGFLKGFDGTNRYPTRMTLMCMSDWSFSEDNLNEFKVVSFTEASLDSKFNPGDPRFNYYACFNGLILEVCYKKDGLHMVLTNGWGKYSDSSPIQQSRRYIAPSSTNNRTYLVHKMINAAFPIYNFFTDKCGFKVNTSDVFHVHHINCHAWDNVATNLIELPLAAHQYIHNKGSFETLTSDSRYSSFHLNLIKLLKVICQGNETRPLSYFIDNGLI
jgi:hypothetical protein